jgi:hypothetical protein
MKIVFLFGEICSGKSTYEFPTNTVKLTVSNIVKRLMQSDDREILQNSKHLDTKIADMIAEDIWHYQNFVFEDSHTTPDYFVIDGIRQYTILEQLEQWFSKTYPDLQLQYKWLEVDREERKRRFEARKDPKDTLTFEEAEKRDNALGLSQLFSILKEQNKI